MVFVFVFFFQHHLLQPLEGIFSAEYDPADEHLRDGYLVLQGTLHHILESESCWYSEIQQTGANIFSVSQTARVPEPNDLLIELKSLTHSREQDNACILVLFHINGTKADFKLNKSICDTNLSFIFEGTTGTKGIKGTFLALCFFSWARVEISRVSRAHRVTKQATIKFDQRFIYKLISYVQTSVKSQAKILFTTRGDLM